MREDDLATAASKPRSWLMVDQTEKFARVLVRALCYATDGEPRWWLLPTNPNDVTKGAIAIAVDRGWMLSRGDSVCLTGAGRELAMKR